jgi:hypothetical protein
LASKIFGARGVGLVDAAVSGKLSLESLNQTFDVTGAGISATASKTGTLSGALGILKNNAKLALAEFATPAVQAANEALRAILPTVQSLGQDFSSLPDSVKIGTVAVVGLASQFGKLGNAAQGLSALKDLGIGEKLATGFQLAAVRGLELVDALKSITLAGALTAGALTLGFAALAAGIFYIFTASEKLGPGFADAEAAGKRMGQSVVAGAKSSADEIKAIETALTRVNDGIKVYKAALDKKTNGSVELQAESDSATRDALSLKQLGAEHGILTKRLGELKQQQREEAAAAAASKVELSGYAAAVTSGKDALKAFADLSEPARKAVNDLNATVLAAQGGQNAYDQAITNIGKAFGDLNVAIATYGANSPQAAAAQQALNSAQLAGIDAADKLDQANQNLRTTVLDPTKYNTELARLEDLKAKYPELAAQYDAQIQKLQFLHTVLVDLPDQKNVTVTADTQAAQDAIERFRSSIASLPGGIFFVPTPAGAAPGTAVGGIFSTPQVRLFAEAGPEAVLPLNDTARSWELIAQSGLLAGAPSPSRAGNTYNTNVYPAQAVIDERYLREILQRVEVLAAPIP